MPNFTLLERSRLSLNWFLQVKASNVPALQSSYHYYYYHYVIIIIIISEDDASS